MSGAALDGVETSYPLAARLFDVAIALLLTPLLLPIGALVGLAVLLDSPGPVLYRSTRIGRDGRRFQMLKFRTMIHRSSGPGVSCDSDARYTPAGRLLSATRLDELPQIWNVLCGQMRLVGPRPEVEQFVLAQPDAYRRVLALPPGITGPTQLAFTAEGKLLARVVDPERTYRDEILPRKVLLDLDYVASASLRLDVAAIARTWLVPGRALAKALARDDREGSRRSQLTLARATGFAFAACALIATFTAQGTAAV